MKPFLEFVEKKDANAFFSKLFAVRDHAHQLHLSTKSYAQHKALGSFYESLLTLIDQIVETYQGEYDLVKLSMGQSDLSDDPLTFIKDFAEYVTESRKLFAGDTHLQNMIDEILSLSYQTLYKVRFLK